MTFLSDRPIDILSHASEVWLQKALKKQTDRINMAYTES